MRTFKQTRCRVRCHRRRGVIAVLAAFLMVVVVACFAFAIDLGIIATARTDLQSAADAASLAGAGRLAVGDTAAREEAQKFFLGNLNDDSTNLEVATGFWNRTTRQFNAGGLPRNAVSVSANSNDRTLFFAPLMGTNTFNTDVQAVAMYRPRDITLVLDHSGSMRTNNKIGALKEAVREFLVVLNDFQADDRVGIAGYSTSASLIEPMTSDLAEVSREVNRLRANGYTNMGGGMEIGIDELTTSARPSSQRMIVLLTDGIANRPLPRADAKELVREMARRARDARIPIVAISFTAASDEAIMREVAEISGGVHFHVNESNSGAEKRELKKVFRQVAEIRPTELVD